MTLTDSSQVVYGNKLVGKPSHCIPTVTVEREGGGVDCKLQYLGLTPIDGYCNDINIYTTLVLTVILTGFVHLTATRRL